MTSHSFQTADEYTLSFSSSTPRSVKDKLVLYNKKITLKLARRRQKTSQKFDVHYPEYQQNKLLSSWWLPTQAVQTNIWHLSGTLCPR